MAYALTPSETRKIRGKRLLTYRYVLNRTTKSAVLPKPALRQLRTAAAEADAGKTIDATGLSDKEFLALLQR